MENYLLCGAGVCFAIYIAANSFDIFDRTYTFANRYENYEVDDLIVVAVAFGFLMLIYALRRVQDLKSEIHKREQAEKKNDDQTMQLAMAVNNIPQGVVLFSERVDDGDDSVRIGLRPCT